MNRPLLYVSVPFSIWIVTYLFTTLYIAEQHLFLVCVGFLLTCQVLSMNVTTTCCLCAAVCVSVCVWSGTPYDVHVM